VNRTLALALVLALAAPAAAQETVLAGLRETARSHPKDATAQTALGQALSRAGHWAEAEKQLKLAAKLQSNSLQSLYEIAKVHFARGDNKAARQACQALVKINGKASLSMVCMARAYLVWKRSSLAFEQLDKAQAVDPENPETILAVADAYRIRGDITQSAKDYQRVISRSPSDARAYLGLGQLYAVFGPEQNAVEALQKAFDRDPTSPEIQLELGRLLKGEKGRQLLQKAVEGRPDWDEAFLALGDAWLSAGDGKSANQYAQKVLALSADSADAHALAGRALMLLGDLPGAEKELRRALELVPNMPAAKFALADLLEKTDRVEDAFEAYRNAAILMPKDTSPLIAAARLAMKLKRNALAAGFLDLALDRAPNSAPVLVLLGEVMIARDDKAAARTYLERALKGEGEIDRERVKELLKQLK
jgi:tetratricopeptide (TPR) repeat protein